MNFYMSKDFELVELKTPCEINLWDRILVTPTYDLIFLTKSQFKKYIIENSHFLFILENSHYNESFVLNKMHWYNATFKKHYYGTGHYNKFLSTIVNDFLPNIFGEKIFDGDENIKITYHDIICGKLGTFGKNNECFLIEDNMSTLVKLTSNFTNVSDENIKFPYLLTTLIESNSHYPYESYKVTTNLIKKYSSYEEIKKDLDLLIN